MAIDRTLNAELALQSKRAERAIKQFRGGSGSKITAEERVAVIFFAGLGLSEEVPASLRNMDRKEYMELWQSYINPR